MKAIVNTAPGKLELLDWPMSSPGPGQVRIKTSACAICATDLLMIAGWARTGFPSIPGHEWSGVVDATGEGVPAGLVGMACVAENVWASDGGEVGFEHPGGYGQYFVTDALNVRPLPEGVDLTAAALSEPTAVCVRALTRLCGGRGHESLGKTLLLGDGPIGLILLAMVSRGLVEGLKADAVAMVGGRGQRLKLAIELGATETVNYHSLGGQNFSTGIRAACRKSLEGREGFNTVIEASGSGAAMDGCLDLAACGGRILIVGDYAGSRASFPWNHVLHRELELVGSNASAGGWGRAVELAALPELGLRRLVTHVLPAENFAEGIELMKSRREDVIKVVLRWE